MMYGRTKTGRLIHIFDADSNTLCGVKTTFVDTRPKIQSAWDVAWSDPWHPRHLCTECQRQHMTKEAT